MQATRIISKVFIGYNILSFTIKRIVNFTEPPFGSNYKFEEATVYLDYEFDHPYSEHNGPFYNPYKNAIYASNNTDKWTLYHELGHYHDRKLYILSDVLYVTMLTGALFGLKQWLFFPAVMFNFSYRYLFEKRADTYACTRCTPDELKQAYDDRLKRYINNVFYDVNDYNKINLNKENNRRAKAIVFMQKTLDPHPSDLSRILTINKHYYNKTGNKIKLKGINLEKEY